MSIDIYTVSNEAISLRFNLSNGIALESIYNKTTIFEHMSTSSPFFLYAVNSGYGYNSNTLNVGGIPGVIVDDSSLSQDERTLTLTCHDNAGLGLSFNIVITAPAGEIAAFIQTDVTNNSSAEKRWEKHRANGASPPLFTVKCRPAPRG